MSKEEILEGNKEIIEFLGGKIEKGYARFETNSCGSETLTPFKYVFPKWVFVECELEKLSYHFDPFWTIPLVNIIGQLGYGFKTYSDTSVKIVEVSTGNIISCISNKNPLKYYPKVATFEESVKDNQALLYQAIVEFCKWYKIIKNA